MKSHLFIYDGNNRDLRKIIMILLKSWNAKEVRKLNYGHKYILKDKWVEKSETKILLIHTENQENLENFLSNNFPQIVKISIN